MLFQTPRKLEKVTGLNRTDTESAAAATPGLRRVRPAGGGGGSGRPGAVSAAARSYSGVPSRGRAGPPGLSVLTATTEKVTTETFVTGGITYMKQTSVTCYLASEPVESDGDSDGDGRTALRRYRSLPCRPGAR